LREVQRLSTEGLSLEGIRRVLDLEDAVIALRTRVRELESALADALLAQPGRRVFAAGSEGEVETLRTGTRVRRRTDVVVWRPLGR
jgi:MerR family transcriptional regulator/heat shock protein HspR